MNEPDLLTDDNLVSVTARHLRDLRRSQDLMLDLIKRQNELFARLERNMTELKSDVALLENRSITAAENDEFFRRRLVDLSEDIARFDAKLDGVLSRK